MYITLKNIDGTCRAFEVDCSGGVVSTKLDYLQRIYKECKANHISGFFFSEKSHKGEFFRVIDDVYCEPVGKHRLVFN